MNPPPCHEKVRTAVIFWLSLCVGCISVMDSSLYFTLYSDVYVCGETGFVFVGPLVFCYRTSGAGVSFWVNGFYIVWNKLRLCVLM